MDSVIVRQILPVSGDWFRVSNPEDHRWFIERVIAWALVTGGGSVDRVCGIGDRGVPEGDPEGDWYYVAGQDSSPAGPTWLEIYQKTAPNAVLSREITDLVEASPSLSG